MASSDRLALAKKLINKKAKEVGEMGLFDAVHALEWFDHMQYDEEAVLKLVDLSDLQKVALAAALVAYAEGVR